MNLPLAEYCCLLFVNAFQNVSEQVKHSSPTSSYSVLYIVSEMPLPKVEYVPLK